MYHIGCSPDCYNPEARTRSKRDETIVLHRDRILYDIENYGYVEGHVLGEENQHAQHTLTDIGQEGNLDLVSRMLTSAFRQVVRLLSPYTDTDDTTQGGSQCNCPDEPEAYELHMQVPATMPASAIRALASEVHDYMVARVLSDWMAMTNPQGAGRWEAKAQVAQANIEELRTARTGTLTRPLQPF